MKISDLMLKPAVTYFHHHSADPQHQECYISMVDIEHKHEIKHQTQLKLVWTESSTHFVVETCLEFVSSKYQ
jgi:hypothetical protein